MRQDSIAKICPDTDPVVRGEVALGFMELATLCVKIASCLNHLIPGEARLSVPAAVDQNGNVSSSSSFFLLSSSTAVRGVLAHDLGRLWTFHKMENLISSVVITLKLAASRN